MAVLVTSLVTLELTRLLGGSGSASVETLDMVLRTVVSAKKKKVERSEKKLQFHLAHRPREIHFLGARQSVPRTVSPQRSHMKKSNSSRRVHELVWLLAADVIVHARMIKMFSARGEEVPI